MQRIKHFVAAVETRKAFLFPAEPSLVSHDTSSSIQTIMQPNMSVSLDKMLVARIEPTLNASLWLLMCYALLPLLEIFPGRRQLDVNGARGRRSLR